MSFVKANLIVILISLFCSPVIALCEDFDGEKNNINKSIDYMACANQGAGRLQADQIVSQSAKEDSLARDYCQKLNKHVAILKKFDDINKKNKIVDFALHNNIIFNIKNIEYKNELAKICIAKMVEQNSLEPFFKTWDYAYSLCISNKDIIFVREFSIVIFSLYENLLTVILNKKSANNLTANLPEQENNSSDSQAIKSLLDDIIQVYNAVSELPIKDIIVTLEKCYVLFSKIINDYGASGSGLGFKQWVLKYWWLPPTIFVAIVGAILRKKISKKLGSDLSKFYYLNKDKTIISDQK